MDVTFSGKPIPQVAVENNVLNPDGTHPTAPTVYFGAYYIREVKNLAGSVIRKEKVYDSRLKFASAYISAKTYYSSTQNNHYHLFTIDADGNGTVEETYNAAGTVITSHQHTVADFTVGTGFDSDNVAHTHDLRSVAENTLLPTPNLPHTICLECTTSYDASKIPTVRTVKKTLEIPYDSIPVDTVKVTLYAPDSASVREGVSSSYAGYTLKAKVQKSTAGGSFVDVPDGTRVKFNIIPSSKQSANGTNYIVIDADSHQFMSLDITASSTVGNSNGSDSVLVLVDSAMNWTDSAFGLVPEITKDSLYINEAMTNIATFGGSPISDAVRLAANRIITYQGENTAWKTNRKIVLLLSDGDENSGSYAYTSAVTAVNAVNGTEKTPVVAYALGSKHPADVALMGLLAKKTGGTLYRIYFDDSNYIEKIVNDTFTNDLPSNIGTYTNSIDLSKRKLQTGLAIQIVLPTGTSAGLKVRFGDSLYDMGEWSEEITVTGTSTIDLTALFGNKINRYLEYRLTLYGSAEFASPQFSYVTSHFIEPRTNYIIFAPIYTDLSDEEFVSQVIISHNLEDGDLTEVNYAALHAETPDLEHAFTNAEDGSFEDDRQRIVLSRHNEPLLSDNFLTYKLAYGSWPDSLDISIYRTDGKGQSGELVDPASYIANPTEGTITFTSSREKTATYVATVHFDPVLKIVCKVENFGEDGVKIHNVGVMYNKSARYKSNDAGIIRRSLDREFDYSYSSSSSESSLSS